MIFEIRKDKKCYLMDNYSFYLCNCSCREVLMVNFMSIVLSQNLMTYCQILSYLWMTPTLFTFFSVVHDISRNKLNEDLNKINAWATQWKMSLNPNPMKQAQEVFFFFLQNKKVI